MARNNGIKGITIAINGDTKGLQDSLKDVNKESKKIQGELNAVERALKLDPGNTALVAQKMDLLADAVTNTSGKLDSLRAAQSQVEAQFANNEIGEEQYRAFTRELSNTEAQLRSYQSQMQTVQSEQQRFADNQRDLQTYLAATGQSVDDLANTLGARLTGAIRDGSASADQLDQALNKIARQAGHTGQNLEEFRSALRNVDSGSNLNDIRTDLMRVGLAADEAEQDVKKFGDGLSNVVGGLVAGGGLAGAITAALDTSSLNTKIEMTMDLDAASADAVRESIKSVTSAIEDEEGALEGVRRQFTLNADASVEENQRIIEGATAIAYAYSDIDFKELIQESHEIGNELGISQQAAMEMVDALLKVGFPPDQLDIISEYGNQLKMAGFNALEIQAIMASGVDTGTWNIDNLLDGIKEGRIVGAEFGAEIDEATQKIIESAGLSATKFQELGNAIAGGGEEGSVAMQELAKMLSTVEDDTTRNALGTKMYGTLWEEQGTKIVDTLMNMDENMKSTTENADGLKSSIETMNSDPAIQLKDAFNNMMTAMTPLLTGIAEIVGKIASWAAENPALTATIAAIGTAVSVLVGAFAFLTPAIGAIIPLFTGGGAAAGVIGTAIAALTGPIGIAIGAITAIIAVGVLLYKNFDEIKEKAGQLKDWIGTKFTELKTSAIEKFTELKTGAVNKFNELKTDVSNKVNEIKTNAVNKFNELKTGAVNKASEILSGIKSKFESVKTTITTAVSNAKDKAVTTFNNLKDSVINGASNIYTNVKSKFNEAKTAITEPIEKAKDTVSEAVDKIKGFFTGLDLKLPDIKMPKLPKFTLTGSFSLNPPSVPKLGIEWFAKGGLMTRPTAFGMNGNNLMVGGEKGREAILPLTASVLAGIGKGIAEQMQPQQQINMPSTIVVQSILDGRIVSEIVTPFVSQNQQSNTTLKAYSRGVSI